MKYFVYNYKNANNHEKLYFLAKIHKRLSNFTGWPVISICRTPIEKASTILDYHLKPVMQSSWSYTKDFIKKLKRISNILDGAILVTAGAMGLYPSIPHELGLNALEEALEKRESIQVSASDLA